MRNFQKIVILYVLLITNLGEVLSFEKLEESLIVRPLRDGKVATTFAFKTLLEGEEPRHPMTLGKVDDAQHYAIFPLTLGQIIREHAVTELHLSLNAGQWNYEQWGYPDELGVGVGAELWAWMGDGAPLSIDTRWEGLRNSLAGLFCASLASMDEKHTTSPVHSFTLEGFLPEWELPHQFRHAYLPSERICTENLTPFLKLLPCKSLSGIASLLNPHKLFDANWHGMGVHVSWHAQKGVEVRLSFQAVFDPLRHIHNKRRVRSQDWSLRALFDRVVERRCPMAHSSYITVHLPKDEDYSIEPTPSSINDQVALFDLVQKSEPLDVNMRWTSEFQYPLNSPETVLIPLSVRRTLQGSSQFSGQLLVTLRSYLDHETNVIYLETMPWLLQFYLHTLQVNCDGILRTPSDSLVSNISYILPVPHSRPTTFQAVVTLPPKATVHLTIDVTKSFLRYTDHQPDAQRGWDLPPAILVPLPYGDSRGYGNYSLGARIYTPALLVDLATPDFSMPYNVIIFSCTVMAFIFGCIFNLLTRKFVVVRVNMERATNP